MKSFLESKGLWNKKARDLSYSPFFVPRPFKIQETSRKEKKIKEGKNNSRPHELRTEKIENNWRAALISFLFIFFLSLGRNSTVAPGKENKKTAGRYSKISSKERVINKEILEEAHARIQIR